MTRRSCPAAILAGVRFVLQRVEDCVSSLVGLLAPEREPSPVRVEIDPFVRRMTR